MTAELFLFIGAAALLIIALIHRQFELKSNNKPDGVFLGMAFFLFVISYLLISTTFPSGQASNNPQKEFENNNQTCQHSRKAFD